MGMIIISPSNDRNRRLSALGWIVGVGLLALVVALFRVQVVHGERYDSRERAQSLRRIRVPSARGEIVDRNGVVLANNRPSYDIVIYLDQLGQVSKRADDVRVAQANLAALSRALGMPVALSDRDVRIHYAVRRPIPLPVWRDLTPKMVAAFEERASNLPGADLIVTPVRQYPFGKLAAHALGYVGKAEQNPELELERFYYYQPDSEGRQGVERACDELLRGSPGGYTVRVDPSGRRVGDVGEKLAEVGNKVWLTLDARIQKIAEDALAGAELPAGRELRGAAVVIDPRTGEVLAMASAPAFDPNIFNPGTAAEVVNAVIGDERSPMFNRAIGARYAPGSTFKTITLLAGLQAGTINPQDTATCAGSMRIGNWQRPFRCWSERGHGTVDAFGAMRQSCDVWFYQKGMATGAERIARAAGEFGLGRATGFDVGLEATGLVPTPDWKRERRRERWWDGDTAQMAIGQSFLEATPLQMAVVAATFANGGTVWQPFLVKRAQTPSGQVVHESQPEARGRLSATAQQIEIVRQAMRGAVESSDGTGHRAAVRALSVAGKTGTAEYDTPRGRRKRAWFIGFAPYEQPTIALSVLFEDADSGGHTAAPVAGQILAGVFGKDAERVTGGGGD
jgi:penicillin-binding protein 2